MHDVAMTSMQTLGRLTNDFHLIVGLSLCYTSQCYELWRLLGT